LINNVSLFVGKEWRRSLQKNENDAGGEVNKTRPTWSKEWNGKFL
jgi:hypothetical protein